MEEFFILKILYQVDLNTGLPNYKKLKKVYLADPLILWSLWGWTENWLSCYDKSRFLIEDEQIKARLVEMVCACHLFAELDKRDWLNSNLFFWKNKGEIDFVAKTHQGLLPVEVKYQKATDFRDLKTIHKLGFKRGLLISRDRLERMDEYWIVPLELFLLYLEEFLEAGN